MNNTRTVKWQQVVRRMMKGFIKEVLLIGAVLSFILGVSFLIATWAIGEYPVKMSDTWCIFAFLVGGIWVLGAAWWAITSILTNWYKDTREEMERGAA